MYEKENAIIFKNLGFIGGILFFSGVVLLVLSGIIIHYYGWYSTKMLYGSIMMIPLGLGMMICPGGDLSDKGSKLRQSGDGLKMTYFRYVRQQAPLPHKVVWIVSLVIGIVLIVYMRDLGGIL